MVMAATEMVENPFYLKNYQAEFVASRAKFPAIVSAWGTGKDLSALARVMALAQESPDNLILILRREFKDLQDSTINDFESYTGIKVNSNGDASVPTGMRPSKIMFRHIEQLNNLQNINLGAFWINQAEELDGPEAFYLLMGRLRRKVHRRTGFVTANANGHNWVYDVWLKNKNANADYPCWEATTYDNADVLPADYVASLKNLPENMYRRFVLNDHSVAEGLVFADFKEAKHTCFSWDMPEIDKSWKEVIALDHGYEHPTAVLFGACNYDGKLIIYGEHYENHQTVSYHANKIKEIEPDYRSMRRVIDPSCRNKMQKSGVLYSIIDEYGDFGVLFQPAQNDWDAGINRVNEYFKNDKIVIYKDKCPNLIREIKAYKHKFPRPGQEKIDERPIKLNDDTCDALRYLIMSRPQAAIKPKPRSSDPAKPLAGELLRREAVTGWKKWNQ